MEERINGNRLIFISKLFNDGSGMVKLTDKQIKDLDLENCVFKITELSLAHRTYIACCANCYIVKIKKFEGLK